MRDAPLLQRRTPKPPSCMAASTAVWRSVLLSLLTLGAEFGDEVVLTAEGSGADEVLDELAELISSELDQQ